MRAPENYDAEKEPILGAIAERGLSTRVSRENRRPLQDRENRLLFGIRKFSGGTHNWRDPSCSRRATGPVALQNGMSLKKAAPGDFSCRWKSPPLAGKNRRHKIRECLPSAGARLNDQVLFLAERCFDRLGISSWPERYS